MMSFDDFNAIYRTNSNGDNKSKFVLLLGVREELIRRIFHYYYSLGEKFNSVMAWAARNSSSPTRKIAERMMFKRIEIGDINNRSEVYYTRDFQGKEFSYLVECNSRWETVFNEAQSRNLIASTRSLSVEKLSRFYRVIVD